MRALFQANFHISVGGTMMAAINVCLQLLASSHSTKSSQLSSKCGTFSYTGVVIIAILSWTCQMSVLLRSSSADVGFFTRVHSVSRSAPTASWPRRRLWLWGKRSSRCSWRSSVRWGVRVPPGERSAAWSVLPGRCFWRKRHWWGSERLGAMSWCSWPAQS